MRVIDEWIIYKGFSCRFDRSHHFHLNSLLIRIKTIHIFKEKKKTRFHLAELILSFPFYITQWLFFFYILQIRLFASKCAKCQESFSKNELYIRTALCRRYHIDCFRCTHCDRLLGSGDEYYVHGPNQILCRKDFQQISSSNESVGTSTAGILHRKKSVWRACILTSVRM